jgi:hypothetical protein
MPKTTFMEKTTNGSFIDNQGGSETQAESTNMEIGYFAELDVNFKSSGEDIKLAYCNKMAELLLDRQKLSLRHDKYILKELQKTVSAYKILEREEDRIEYLNMLRIRSFASQYLSVTP